LPVAGKRFFSCPLDIIYKPASFSLFPLPASLDWLKGSSFEG